MNEYDRAFEVEQGLIIDEGAFVTGGSELPHLNTSVMPTHTLYVQIQGDGVFLWKRSGSDAEDWLPLQGLLEQQIFKDYDLKIKADYMVQLSLPRFDCGLIVDGLVRVL